MVLPKGLARFNRVATNRINKHVAPWAPGFGMIVHKGRKSGREYRTPVNVFRTPGGFVVALTYGPDADWVKNVLAADGATVITRRRNYRVHGAEVVHDESRRAMPTPVRQVLGLLNVHDFLLLKRD
ncbi:nitroreductase family deazaflavin-dependent oxidoreductase [Amycolatopsis australiensis]|uniref:Deazaflavin-dependent oxidoreductase, nitroreductase family n=1 Tax=Amycolatopsis australiensis TaxID=546364 RepID=A0A1K1Q5W7_9PSEU|nr:nitroreductase family deazaflavin-dependent oxidoreductase [Amycolatopsis australiensis]SFW55287.1 deazaflavin-dependent oxidoreductase, nitroreductase family [Amycolatopsis australiensis]